MKDLALLLMLLAGALDCLGSQVPKPSAAIKKEDKCSVAGMVVKLAGSEPLRKVRVRLESTEDWTHSISTVTDEGGRFQLKSIDPGRYRLVVSRVGFVSQEYGQHKPNDPGSAMTLRPGQEVKDLVFRLIPSAVIAGRILDEDGEPLPFVSVTASRQGYSEGKRTVSMSAVAETNDLGDYRLFGLPPGRYVVSAVYPHWSRTGGQDDEADSGAESQGYAKMYYPGTVEASKATPIAIKGGEEIPSVEILMRKVPVYRIRGRVYNEITHKPGLDVNIILLPKSNRRELELEQNTFVAKGDGSFEMSEVLPGSYVLTAYWPDEGKLHSTRVPVDVGNANVEGLAVTITPGMNISGHITWEGQPSLEKDQLDVNLKFVETGSYFRGGARVNSADGFTLKDVAEGVYQAEVYGQSKDCYIKDMLYGGSSSLEGGFTVTRGAASALEITLSSRGARIQGAVTDADALPAAGVWVVLVPDQAHRGQERSYKNQATDQYGRFDLRGILPGDYKLFSWEEVESGAWEDTEFLKPFEEKGEKITVQESDQKTLNLVAIRTRAHEEAKP